MSVTGICLHVALLCAVGTAAVAAEPDRFYISLDVGKTSLQDSSAQYGSGDGTGFSVRGGFQFSRYFSMEAGYVDLGAITRTSGGPYCTRVEPGVTLPTLPPFACLLTTTTEARGAVANLRGSVPLGERFVVSGFLGVVFLDVISSGRALTYTPDLGEPCCYRNIEARRGRGYDASANYGASLSFRALRQLELSVDWTRIQEVPVLGDGSIYYQGIEGNGEYDMYSVGVRLRF